MRASFSALTCKALDHPYPHLASPRTGPQQSLNPYEKLDKVENEEEKKKKKAMGEGKRDEGDADIWWEEGMSCPKEPCTGKLIPDDKTSALLCSQCGFSPCAKYIKQ
eukprot:gb/GEZN01031222.1/.p1 GENE.gb/GEZN01031222.1/~~gb/GEZN01031222.1/.p1  ORF type:complete len:107 (+),score=27.32 gb/GEZN01031222.1/:79-399(+)